ncbi:dienelactone hydrolase family protein [soil metagenome]
MVHGRGGSAEDILPLTREVGAPGFAYLAPQAAGHTWYPYSFLMPVEQNEPYLSSALATIDRVLGQVAEAGIPAGRTVLLGFSQGACLASEFVARNARCYGGLIVFSGGLIGSDVAARDYPGSLDGTPVFIGCSDVDAHIPEKRVRETAAVFEHLGGDVDMRIYPGMGHNINQDELRAAKVIVTAVMSQAAGESQ